MFRSVAAYLCSCLLVIIVVAGIQFGSDAAGPLGFLRILIAPGYLPAAVFYPEGIHSGSPRAFVALIVLFDGLIYGVPLFLLLRRLKRRNAK